ncbi:hypothetical protein LJC45_01285 [Alistipes sp. OttesenSCG-928-B03]|nr:hypothetical protein [Alistipes sp. OttesenSCG-928-B03]
MSAKTYRENYFNITSFKGALSTGKGGHFAPAEKGQLEPVNGVNLILSKGGNLNRFIHPRREYKKRWHTSAFAFTGDAEGNAMRCFVLLRMH